MRSAAKPLSSDVLDFAPGLLSIQESPPARLPRTVLYCVAALFAILLVWATFGKLDIVASAEGRLVPQTYVKIVQPAEAGIVQEILIREGQSVEAGQILMRMDAKLTEADARTLRHEHELKRLQLRRIDAELAGLPMRREAADAPEIYAQVANQYAAHRQAYQDALAQEQAILAKTRHDLQASEELARKLRETVPTYRKSAAAFEKLGQDGFYSTLAVDEKQRDRIEDHELHPPRLRSRIAIRNLGNWSNRKRFLPRGFGIIPVDLVHTLAPDRLGDPVPHDRGPSRVLSDQPVLCLIEADRSKVAIGFVSG